MREKFEKAFAALLIVGGICFLVGGFLLFLGFMGGSGEMLRPGGVRMTTARTALLGYFLTFGGLFLLVGTTVSAAVLGLTERRGVRQIDRQTKVIARYAYNNRGEQVMMDWEFDDPNVKYYVRLQLGNGHRAEFQCVPEVFGQCGEGMSGEAHYQGRWLGYFKPYIGTPGPS